MSTILKALRRLEDEREVQARELRGQVVSRPRGGGARTRFPLLVIAGAIGAVLVIAGFLVMDGRVLSNREAPAVAFEPASLPPASTEIAAPAPLVAPRLPVPSAAVPPRFPAAPVAEPYVAAPRITALASPLTPATRSVRAVSPRATPKPAPRVATALRTPPRSLPAVAASALPEPVATAAPKASLPPIARSESVVPAIVGQPEVVRRSPFPRLTVERTLWHPWSERRLAYLQIPGREGTAELREGDVVGDAVVKQIDPSAVVFLHGGVEIRRRIGEAY